MAKRKEVHFFDHDDFFKRGGPDYSNYHSWFQPSSHHLVIGEATPIYMYWKSAPQRMHQYNPEMKLIFLLRNPIQRAYSHWNMERTRGTEKLTFLDALLAEKGRLAKATPTQHRVYSYIDRGLYSQQLRRVEYVFPRKQLLVLKQEDLATASGVALQSIADFLNLSAFPKIENRKVHSTPYAATMSSAETNLLRGAFRQEITDLEDYLGWDCRDWLD